MKSYTTSTAAEILGVSAKKVMAWCDQGMLRCKTLPGGNGHRRISEADIMEFCWKHKLTAGGLRILVVMDATMAALMVADLLNDTRSLLQTAAPWLKNSSVRCVSDAFSAGLEARSFQPHGILVDLQSIGVHLAAKLAELIPDGPWKPILGLTGTNDAKAYLGVGYSLCWAHGTKPEAISLEFSRELVLRFLGSKIEEDWG